MLRVRAAILALSVTAGLAAGTACAGPERTAAPLPDSVYVSVMARLSAIAAAQSSPEDPVTGTEADSLRKAVLREHGLSPAELEEHARSLGDEPRRMRRLWERTVDASDSLRSVGWPGPAEPDTATGGPSSERPPRGPEGGG